VVAPEQKSEKLTVLAIHPSRDRFNRFLNISPKVETEMTKTSEREEV
jgi:hypothetical protein